MKFRNIRIVFTKGWTLLVCLFTVVIIACSCRSKKVSKSPEPDPVFDAQALDKMTLRVDSLKKVLDYRSRALIYGTPEIMQRRAAENEAIRHEIDSLDNEIKKMMPK